MQKKLLAFILLFIMDSTAYAVVAHKDTELREFKYSNIKSLVAESLFADVTIKNHDKDSVILHIKGKSKDIDEVVLEEKEGKLVIRRDNNNYDNTLIHITITMPKNISIEANIAGTGKWDIAEVDAPVSIKISGSGNVNIDRGYSPDLNVQINGSGQVKFDGVAKDVSLIINGSGYINVKKVEGSIKANEINGSGKINIGR